MPETQAHSESSTAHPTGGSRTVVAYTDPGELDPTAGAALLREAGFEVRLIGSNNPAQILHHAQDATVLVITYADVTREVIEGLPHLKMIATMSAGVDMVDLQAARDHDVWVANIPDASTDEVAAHAFAMLLSVIRGLPEADATVRSGGWTDDLTTPLPRPTELRLGVVGMGLIGRRLTSFSLPLFREVIGYDPVTPDALWPAGVRRVTFQELIATADAVSVHVPLLPQTRGMFDVETISAMKRGAYLVNVARGGIVDETALIQALEAGHLGGAAIDVFEVEPPAADSPSRHHPKLLLSPHSAYLSTKSMAECALAPALNVISWQRSGSPTHVGVDPRKDVVL